MIPTWVTDSRGAVYLNDALRYVKGTFLVGDATQVPVVIPAAPSATIPNRVAPVILTGGEDALSVIFSNIGRHLAGVDPAVAARMSCVINDLAYRRALMNRDILVNQVFGSQLQPYFLNESIMLTQQQAINIQFFNNSIAGATNFDFAFEAGKYQASVLLNPDVTEEIADLRVRKTFLNPFWLTSDIAIALPAGGVGTAVRPFFFSVTRDIFFFAMHIMSQVIATGGPLIQDNYEFRILDAKTNRPLIWDGQFVLESCGTGTANFPFVLPTALVTEPNTKIVVEIRNLNANPIEIFFTFGGVADYVSMMNPYRDRAVQDPAPSAFSVGAT